MRDKKNINKSIRPTRSQNSTVEMKQMGVKNVSKNTLYITPLGEKTTTFDENKALGKIVNEDGKTAYYIKCNGQRQPYNPYEREFELNSRRIGMRLGVCTYTFLKTTLNGLENYISFLKTRQTRFYRNTLGDMK